MLDVILFRHAIAEDRLEFARSESDDDLRPLTVFGRERLTKVARRFKKLHSSFDGMISSPLVRAQQTADVLSAVYGLPFETWKELRPEADPMALMELLRLKDGKYLFVGHEPHLSRFTSLAMSGAPEGSLKVKKSGFVELRFERVAPGLGELGGVVAPRHLLKL